MALTSSKLSGTENSPGVRSGGPPGMYGSHCHTKPSLAFCTRGCPEPADVDAAGRLSRILRRRYGVVERIWPAAAAALPSAPIFVCRVSPIKQSPNAFFAVAANAQEVVAKATTCPPGSGTPSDRFRLATRAGSRAARAASKRSHHTDWPQPDGWCSHRFSGGGPSFVRLRKLPIAFRKASTKLTPQRERSPESTGVSMGNATLLPSAATYS
mmetsp:Transcript_1865/g.4150  ORF Transcript_1865/g.4150 Transcript_1865/m.4150 type:complete len:212 (+) Transcript_1865:828-1463(+)